jgi:GT2 family glycosyltransferase
MSQTDTAILTLNYSRSNLTESFFKYNFVYDDGEIWVIIDNGSNLEHVNKLKKLASGPQWTIWRYVINHKIWECEKKSNSSNRFILLLLPTNLGYAKGYNIACSFIGEKYNIKYILICNNDIFWESNVIQPLKASLQLDQSLAIACPQVIDRNGNKQNPGLLPEYNYKKMVINRFCQPFSSFFNKTLRRFPNNLAPNKFNGSFVNLDLNQYYCQGSIFLIRYDIFQSIGFFEKKTFLFAEEAILTKKIRDKHLSAIMDNNLIVQHLHQQTEKSLAQIKDRSKIFDQSVAFYLSTYTSVKKIYIEIFLLSGFYFRHIWLPLKYIIKRGMKYLKYILD